MKRFLFGAVGGFLGSFFGIAGLGTAIAGTIPGAVIGGVIFVLLFRGRRS
jgi:hypothetical protein